MLFICLRFQHVVRATLYLYYNTFLRFFFYIPLFSIPVEMLDTKMSHAFLRGSR
jgi:hypothetical protein